jgi:hypothetical protein
MHFLSLYSLFDELKLKIDIDIEGTSQLRVIHIQLILDREIILCHTDSPIRPSLPRTLSRSVSYSTLSSFPSHFSSFRHAPRHLRNLPDLTSPFI